MSLNHLRRRTLVVALATATLAGSLATSAAANPPAKKPPVPKADFTLTLLHANDLESALLPITGTDGGTYGGVDRFVELIQREQAAAVTGKPGAGQAGRRGVVTVSAGDNFLPGPNLAASKDSGLPIYDATAFNAAGFDVSILGNHDFDQSPDFLAEWIDDVDPDTAIVSNNLGFEKEPALLARVEDGTIVSSHVEKVRGERIGFIGLTTPILPTITSARRVTVDPELATIANAQAAAYEAAGVDKIVLVSHLQDIDNELALAGELTGIDVIIAGGGHELLANPDQGDLLVPNGTPLFGSYPQLVKDADGGAVPVVTTAALYSYVGRLVVSFNKRGELLQVHDDVSKPLRVSAQGPDAVDPDAAVNRQVTRPVQEYVAELARTVVGSTAVTLDGVQTNVRSRETNMGNLVADSLLAAGRREADRLGVTAPIVAFQNGGGIRNNVVIRPGNITELDTYTILPFPNFVAVAPKMPVSTFLAAVERGVGAPASNDTLGAAGQFLQASGYRVQYDASRPAGSRVVTLTLDNGTVLVSGGQPTGALETISVATIDFTLRNGDGYNFTGVNFSVLPLTYQQALLTYLQGDLGGRVLDSEYPAGGEGRIVEID
jgi:5'-nucleotidase/UDP-sugar diphosphatase